MNFLQNRKLNHYIDSIILSLDRRLNNYLFGTVLEEYYPLYITNLIQNERRSNNKGSENRLQSQLYTELTLYLFAPSLQLKNIMQP